MYSTWNIYTFNYRDKQFGASFQLYFPLKATTSKTNANSIVSWCLKQDLSWHKLLLTRNWNDVYFMAGLIVGW